MRTDQIMAFKSHIGGKNADVVIYPDRIEWHLTSMSTGKKLALGAATMGVSLAATGVSGAKKGSEVIPVKHMSSVTTEKDGMRFTKVVVVSSGNTIGFRVSHGEAEPIRTLLTQLMLGSHPSQQEAATNPPPPVSPQAPPPPPAAAPAPPPPAVAATPAPAPAAAPSPAERIAAAKDLLDQGLISQEDFEAKRQAILDSI